jgi:hypothetical protein
VRAAEFNGIPDMSVLQPESSEHPQNNVPALKTNRPKAIFLTAFIGFIYLKTFS